MKKNKTSRIALIINLTLSILLFIILLNFSIHVIRTKRFNNQIHSLSNGEISKEINIYGRMTGEWPKEDALVPGVTNGGTYEYTVVNTAEYPVENWSVRLDIQKECYLNQGWNGEIEVHQNVKSDIINLWKTKQLEFYGHLLQRFFMR